MFCRRCGQPGHMAEDKETKISCTRKPLCSVPGDETVAPCLYCAQRHGGNSCPKKKSPVSHKCLNCGEKGHRTESPFCKNESAVKHHEKCRAFGRATPWWARAMNIPEYPEIRWIKPKKPQRKVNKSQSQKQVPPYHGPPCQPGAFINAANGGIPPAAQSDGMLGSSSNPIITEDHHGASEAEQRSEPQREVYPIFTKMGKRKRQERPEDEDAARFVDEDELEPSTSAADNMDIPTSPSKRPRRGVSEGSTTPTADRMPEDMADDLDPFSLPAATLSVRPMAASQPVQSVAAATMTPGAASSQPFGQFQASQLEIDFDFPQFPYDLPDYDSDAEPPSESEDSVMGHHNR
jgi:hypothetical protein